MKTDLNILMKGLADVRARQIYLTKYFNETANVYDDSYTFAVCKSIYPLFHEDRNMETDDEKYKLQLPFYETYELKEETISELADYLDGHWMNQNYFNFYQIENHYRNTWTGNSLRSDLINCLRYFFLDEKFDEIFWNKILEPSGFPIEASRITSTFDKNELK